MVSVVAVAVVAALLLSGVLGGGSSDNPGSGDEIAQKVLEAITKPGMVYQVVGTDGSVAWIDPADEEYRRRDATLDGGLTSVGKGWTRYSYDIQNNVVAQDDTSPTGAQRPRIDDPLARWTDPTAALAFSGRLEVTGREVADGKQVIVLQASTPVVDKEGNQAGTLFGRVEIDAETFLPHAFQRRQVLANGTTPTPAVAGQDPNARVVYTSDFIPRSSLAADFFDQSIVQQQVKTNQNGLQQVRDIGLTPLWFGVYYDGRPYGELQLPPTVSIAADSEAKTAHIDYALVSPTLQSEGAVIIRLAEDTSQFTHPQIPQFAGDLPENEETVTAGGVTATLYTSILTVNALPCPAASCPHSDAKLYRRLVFKHGDAAVQIEVEPRLDDQGNDLNGFNSRDGIISLAGVLTEVPADAVMPTPAPASP
ncbi:MAG TPA: hypothetical protein VMT90_05170 [Dehalococcoidia bacterium]|nr:hypothetical protein [Dehalococcoidia bacterium]